MIKLMKGDCLERMKEIESGSVDMVLTDPPYGTTACKWDSIIPLEPMWEQLNRIIKPNGAIVMTASQPFTTTLISSNIKNFKYCWFWEKEQGTGFARAKKQPLRKHEDILVFYSKPPFYNSVGEKLSKPRIIKRKANSNNKSNSDSLANSEDRVSVYTHSSKHTLLRFNRDRGKHPTQKPVTLMEYLIKTYTNEGETVLDFTMGSGTTGVACKNLNRLFIGIEMDDKYFEIAKERISKETRQQELF